MCILLYYTTIMLDEQGTVELRPTGKRIQGTRFETEPGYIACITMPHVMLLLPRLDRSR
jgi:hypothetical protein